LICPDGGNWGALGRAGRETCENAWQVVKAGRCDENALLDLAASCPTPPQDYCAASISRRRVSDNCGTGQERGAGSHNDGGVCVALGSAE